MVPCPVRAAVAVPVPFLTVLAVASLQMRYALASSPVLAAIARNHPQIHGPRQ